MFLSLESRKPLISADIVVFGFDGNYLNVLLLKRWSHCSAFAGAWEIPGSFISENDKNIPTTASRALRELVRIKVPASRLRQIGTYSEIDRDPRERVISVAHYVLLNSTDTFDYKDYENIEWFKLSKIPSMAFDHKRIIRDAIKRLKQDIHPQPLTSAHLTNSFTLSQLESIYKSIEKF